MLRKILLSSSVVLTTLLPLSTASGAVTHPYHFLQIPNSRVSNGAPISFSYRSSSMPNTDKLFLQLQEGTGHVWRNIVELRHYSGSFRTTGLPMGKYIYRIAFLKGSATGPVMAASPAVTLYAYANVSFNQLCNDFAPGNVTSGITCSLFGSNILGGTAKFFKYIAVMYDTVAPYPSFRSQLAVPTSTCRSVSLQFAENMGPIYDPSTVPYSTYVRFSQGSVNPVEASATPNGVGSLTAQIVPGGSWVLSVSAIGSNNSNVIPNGQSVGAGSVLVNGTFSCYTPSGR